MKRKLTTCVLHNYWQSEKLDGGISFMFLIIQEREREIREIERKIYISLRPIQNQEPDIVGSFKGRGLVYRLLRFDSTQSPNMLQKPFERFYQDKNLYDREKPSLIERYILSLAE